MSRDHFLIPKEFRLWFTPVVFPFYRTYDVLRQSSAACKALKVLKTTVLKRLASAVQLRPWPPCFQSFTSTANLNLVPFCPKTSACPGVLPQNFSGCDPRCQCDAR